MMMMMMIIIIIIIIAEREITDMGCHGYHYTLADSFINASTNSAGAAAETATSRKSTKYADLSTCHIFN